MKIKHKAELVRGKPKRVLQINFIGYDEIDQFQSICRRVASTLSLHDEQDIGKMDTVDTLIMESKYALDSLDREVQEMEEK